MDLRVRTTSAPQAFNEIIPRPISISEVTRRMSIEALNPILADTMALRDLYKKSHWQATGPTFYQLHLLFDSHYGQQADIVDLLAERIMMLGGVSIATAADVVELTSISRVPRDRERPPQQIERLLDAHQIILTKCRSLARMANDSGDFGTNDLILSDVIRPNEKQVWFLSEHLTVMPFE